MDEDLDRAYVNREFIPGGDDYPQAWAEAAASWREIENAVGRARLNEAYGPGERQALDLFLPRGRPAGLLVFVHGGYWIQFDRKLWSHFAAGATARGWAVAMPSYTLAPQARISQMTGEIAAALGRAAALVPGGPMVVTGHSAGGHLAARMACADLALPDPVAARLARVVPISPLSDLVHMLPLAMNEGLRMTAEEARRESPVNHRQRAGIGVDIWVGAEERPVFLDHARWLDAAWPDARLRIAPGRHHFDIIDGLCAPDTPLMESLLGGCGA